MIFSDALWDRVISKTAESASSAQSVIRTIRIIRTRRTFGPLGNTRIRDARARAADKGGYC